MKKTLVSLAIVSIMATGCSLTTMKGESGEKKASMKTYGMDSTGVLVSDDIIEIHAKAKQEETF